MRGPTVYCPASELSTPNNGQLGPIPIILKRLQSQNLLRPSASLLALIVNLALIILAAVLNLFHEVPDHEEEVGAEHPPKDAEHDDGGAEVESSQDHPRLHEADVPLKYKDKASL